MAVVNRSMLIKQLEQPKHTMLNNLNFQLFPEADLLDIYQKTANPNYALGLFAKASALRDQHLGTAPWWSAGVSAITACELEKLCTYCTFFTSRSAPMQDIVAAMKCIADLGIRHAHLSGGTLRLQDQVGGYDGYLVELVQAIQQVTDIELEINVGPSLSRQGVQDLKALGVGAITSSLEVLNKDIFARYKPGDSLKERIRLMEICAEEGMPIRSMMLVGLGETDQDRIEHLMFLRRFPTLTHLRLSRYLPFPGTDAGGVRCSPWPVARLVAMARLLFPSIDIGLAAGNDPDDMALWWLAGGGNQILGASASMKSPKSKKVPEAESIVVGERVVVQNNMAKMTRYLADLGLTPVFSPVQDK